MEIEIRAKVSNIDELEQRVIKLGAKLLGRKEQSDKYFGEINLFKKLGYSFLMRVRDEGDVKFLSYKGAATKRDGIWEEYEFSIDDELKAETMLTAMGLERVLEVRKTRIEYKLGDLNICLDTVVGLGSFIEIESLDVHDASKHRLEELIGRLGIKVEQIKHKGYVTMLLIKNNSPYSKYIIN